jgi:hypothetical protein
MAPFYSFLAFLLHLMGRCDHTCFLFVTFSPILSDQSLPFLSESRLHLDHPRTGKQSARFRLTFGCRDAGIDEGILDIGMA